MRPFFFGEAERPLYGVYEAPRAASRSAGVVLCYPAAHEYNLVHWAFRKLASQLAQAGFHVLRFDWSSTGDSAGETQAGNTAQWLSDLRLAIDELREQSGLRAVSLIGLRLGAALAYQCAVDTSVKELVLWEPVVVGREYVKELRGIDDRRRLRLLHPPGPADELLGFVFPKSQREALESLDLREVPTPKARRVLIFSASESPQLVELQSKLRATGIVPEVHPIPQTESLLAAAEREAGLLPGRTLPAIIEAMSGGSSV